MFFARFFAAASALGYVSAFSILAPGGPDVWWVANSDNVLSWTCHDNPPAQVYQLLLNNTNPAILASADAILAVLNNADCTHTLTTQQVNIQAATGYTLIIADQTDQTKIYATSQPFEVKALGSAYPPASATPTDSSGTAATSSGASSSSSSTSGANASSNKSSAKTLAASLAGVLAAAGGVLAML